MVAGREAKLYHTTRNRRTLNSILKDSCIRPSAGKVCFTRNPFLSNSISPYSGYVLVYSEKLIKNNYGGQEEVYPADTCPSLKNENEIYTIVPVDVKGCIEILTSESSLKKYGFGRKYHYKNFKDE